MRKIPMRGVDILKEKTNKRGQGNKDKLLKRKLDAQAGNNSLAEQLQGINLNQLPTDQEVITTERELNSAAIDSKQKIITEAGATEEYVQERTNDAAFSDLRPDLVHQIEGEKDKALQGLKEIVPAVGDEQKVDNNGQKLSDDQGGRKKSSGGNGKIREIKDVDKNIRYFSSLLEKTEDSYARQVCQAKLDKWLQRKADLDSLHTEAIIDGDRTEVKKTHGGDEQKVGDTGQKLPDDQGGRKKSSEKTGNHRELKEAEYKIKYFSKLLAKTKDAHARQACQEKLDKWLQRKADLESPHAEVIIDDDRTEELKTQKNEQVEDLPELEIDQTQVSPYFREEIKYEGVADELRTRDDLGEKKKETTKKNVDQEISSATSYDEVVRDKLGEREKIENRIQEIKEQLWENTYAGKKEDLENELVELEKKENSLNESFEKLQMGDVSMQTESKSEEKGKMSVVEKPINRNIENYFAKEFNLSPKDLKTVKGFGELSEAQQRLVLTNMKQWLLSEVQIKGEEKFAQEQEELRYKGESKGVLGKAKDIALKGVSLFRSIGKNFFKGYKVEQRSKNSYEEIQSGKDKSSVLEVMQSLVEGAKNTEARMENGKLVVDYFKVPEGIDKVKEKEIKEFNKVASEFSRMPSSWGSETFRISDKKKYKEYHDAEDRYEKAKQKIAGQFEETNKDIVGPEKGKTAEGERAIFGKTLLDLNQIDSQVNLDQFLNTHPEVEAQLQNIKDTGFRKWAWRNVADTFKLKSDKAAPLFVGYASRYGSKAALSYFGITAATTTGAIAAPVVAVGIGAGLGYWRGKIRGREDLSKLEISSGRKNIAKQNENREKRISAKIELDKLTNLEGAEANDPEVKARITELKKNLSIDDKKSKERERAFEELAKLEKMGNYNEQIIKRIAELNSEFGPKDKKERNFVNSDGLANKIESLLQKINNEEDVAKKRELVESLKIRLNYTEDKMRKGLVNFGDNKETIANTHILLKALAGSSVILKELGYSMDYKNGKLQIEKDEFSDKDEKQFETLKQLKENKTITSEQEIEYNKLSTKQRRIEKKETIENRLDRVLANTGQKITESQKDHIRKSARRGAYFGATFAEIGIKARDWFGEDIERFIVDHTPKVVRDAISSGAEKLKHYAGISTKKSPAALGDRLRYQQPGAGKGPAKAAAAALAATSGPAGPGSETLPGVVVEQAKVTMPNDAIITSKGNSNSIWRVVHRQAIDQIKADPEGWGLPKNASQHDISKMANNVTAQALHDNDYIGTKVDAKGHRIEFDDRVRSGKGDVAFKLEVNGDEYEVKEYIKGENGEWHDVTGKQGLYEHLHTQQKPGLSKAVAVKAEESVDYYDQVKITGGDEPSTVEADANLAAQQAEKKFDTTVTEIINNKGSSNYYENTTRAKYDRIGPDYNSLSQEEQLSLDKLHKDAEKLHIIPEEKEYIVHFRSRVETAQNLTHQPVEKVAPEAVPVRHEVATRNEQILSLVDSKHPGKIIEYRIPKGFKFEPAEGKSVKIHYGHENYQGEISVKDRQVMVKLNGIDEPRSLNAFTDEVKISHSEGKYFYALGTGKEGDIVVGEKGISGPSPIFRHNAAKHIYECVNYRNSYPQGISESNFERYFNKWPHEQIGGKIKSEIDFTPQNNEIDLTDKK